MAVVREQVVQTAEKFVSRGKIEPAIREYRKLLADNPNDINTLNRIGDLYARIQRIDEAVEFFNQIGEQYAAQGFFVKAIAIYKKIIKLDPTRLEVYERLADLYHKQNLVNEARTQYQVLADYYTKHDNAPSAIAIYSKMADLEPENPSYHVKLAEIYHQQKLFEKAVNEYRIIAEMMIQHGRPQEAAQVYERALGIDSKNLLFIRSAVDALREAGADAAAARFLSVAVERNPEAQQVVRELDRPAPREEPQPEVLPEISQPEPPAAPSAPAADASIELEIDLGDDLMSAMREAEAAVSQQAPAAPAVEPESEDLEFDLGPLEELTLELPQAEDLPSSQVQPPADMPEMQRPAWAQETVPAELDDLNDLNAALEIGDLSFELEPLAELPVAPQPAPDYTEAEVFVLDEEIDLEVLPDIDAIGELPEAVSAVPVWEAEAAPPAPVLSTCEEAERDELITEAEVLAKYGLEEKALERLEEALRQRPDSLAAYALMIRLHLDKHRHEQVLDLARRMFSAAASAGHTEPWGTIKSRLVEAGYAFEGDEVIAGPYALVEPEPVAPPIPAPEPSAPPPPVVEPPVEPAAPTPPARPSAAKRKEMDDLLRGILGKPARKPAAKAAPAAAPPQPVAPPAVETPKPAPPSPPVPPVPPAPASPPAVTPSKPPVSARSGLFDLTSLGSMIEAEELGAAPAPTPLLPVEPVEPVAAPSIAPATGTRPFTGGLEDSGVGWLDEAEAGKKEQAAAGLFHEEDDFFDLAGELVEELSKEEVFQDGILVQQEQSLEEIVEGFKKGVAEHLSPTDYDTHYNLGIAYREMGLLDEAIGEFQLAAKDPGHLVVCCSMLGLCFLDKGLPELSVKWYRRGLEAPGLNEEDQLGLMYDLGNAYMAMGDDTSAYGTFVEIYGINTNYRDVVAKLEELRR